MSRRAAPRGDRVQPGGQRRRQRREIERLQRAVDQSAQDPLAQAFRRRVDGRDALEVDQAFLVLLVLDDLELRVVDDRSARRRALGLP